MLLVQPPTSSVEQMEAVRCTLVPTLTPCNTPRMFGGVSVQKAILLTPNNCATACCSVKSQFRSLADATRSAPPSDLSSKRRAPSVSSSHGPCLARHHATVPSSLGAESNAKSSRHPPQLPLKDWPEASSRGNEKFVGKGATAVSDASDKIGRASG